MKPFLFFLLLLPCTFAHSQAPDDSTGMKLFDKAMQEYSNGNQQGAIDIWTEIVEKKIAIQYDTYGSAFFNIPTVYWQIKAYEKAKEWYKKVLASDLKDNGETGSLMEPHTNYKHKSAYALAGLYNRDSNFTETLHWLNLADTVYRYWGFEGSATNVSLRQSALLTWKTQVLIKLNRKEEAIRAIVTELLCAETLGDFFETSETDLFALVDKKTLRKELDAALEKMVIKPVDAHNWTVVFTLRGLVYRIPLCNVYPDRNLPHYWRMIFIKGDVPNKNELIKHIRESGFYEKLG